MLITALFEGKNWKLSKWTSLKGVKHPHKICVIGSVYVTAHCSVRELIATQHISCGLPYEK